MISLPDIEKRLGIKISNSELDIHFDMCRIMIEFHIESLPCRYQQTYYSCESRIDLEHCFNQFEKEIKETLQKLGLFKEPASDVKAYLYYKWSPIAQDFVPEVSLKKLDIDAECVELVAKHRA
jgi:hypothetical protein